MSATTTLLHVSDFHFGWPFLPAAGEALVAAAAEIAPSAVAISGDLVQRGDFIRLFEEARAFVARLPKPQVIVPGNHDIPLWNPLRRGTTPFERYRAYICDELDPVLSVPGATIAGINTARPWVLDLGYVSDWQLDRVAQAFAKAPAGALRVVTMHHPLLPQPETGWVRHHVYGHRRAIRRLAAAGAEVVLSGHNHYPMCGPIATYEPEAGYMIIAQAGTTTSKRLRAHHVCNVQAFNVVRATAGEVAVERWTYEKDRFTPQAAARFERRPAAPAAAAR